MWSQPSNEQSAQADGQKLAGNISNPPQVAAAAVVAQGQSAKDIESKPRPTRPLSAYNLFFQAERQNMLEVLPVRAKGKPRHSHGKIGFADLARKIAARWKSLTKEEREPFDERAAVEKKRYAKELKVWKREQEEAKQAMRREHELMVQARAGLGDGSARGMSLDAAAAAAGFRDPTTSGVLHLPSTAGNLASRVMPIQAFEEFPGMMQHPNQQFDPAMLSSNTAPSLLDTSNPSWGASNQAFQQARQMQLIAQERQRALQMDVNFPNMPSASRDMGLGGYGPDMSNQFNVASQNMGRVDLMNQMAATPSEMQRMRQMPGMNDAIGYQGQTASPYGLYGAQQAAHQQNAASSRYTGVGGMGNPYAAASLGTSERNLMGSQFSAGTASGRMSGMDPSSLGTATNWDSSYAAGSGFATSPAATQQRAPNSGGPASSDEMARFLRGHFN